LQAIKEVPGDITKRRFGKRVKDRGTDCLKRLRVSLYPVPQPLSNRICAPSLTAGGGKAAGKAAPTGPA